LRETGIAHKGRRNVRDPEFRCPHASPIHWKLFYMVSLCHDFPYGSSHRGSDRNVDTNNRKGIRKKALKGISGHLDPTLYSRGAPVLPDPTRRLRNSTWRGAHNAPHCGTRTVLVDFPSSSRAARRASSGKGKCTRAILALAPRSSSQHPARSIAIARSSFLFHL